LYLSNLRDGQRLAAVALYRFLPSLKRWRRWWWRGLGYHRTLLHRGGRLMFRGSCRTQHCLFGRHDSRLPDLHLRAGHLPCINSYRIPRYRLRRRKGLLARGHNRAGNPLIHICNVGHPGVVDYRSLIIIIDHPAVHSRVRNVHVLNIPLAHAVRRHVHFTRPQRKPTDRSSATTDRDSHAKTTAADKRY
jgi:hypothetical protein